MERDRKPDPLLIEQRPPSGMILTPNNDVRFARAVACIAVVAFAARIGWILSHQTIGDGRYFLISGDGLDYHLMAEKLSVGRGYVQGFGRDVPSGRPPLWPMLLAVLSRVTGSNVMRHHQLLAAAVGASSVVLVAYLARRVGGRRPGLIAGTVAAMYPGFWVYEWPLLSETLLLPTLAAFLLTCYRYIDRPTPRGAAAVGGLLALTALVRSEQAMLGVVVLWLFGRQFRGNRVGALRDCALSFGIAASLLVPWVLFNQTRFAEPVWLSTGLGNTMLTGSCDTAYRGELQGLYDPTCSRSVNLGSLDSSQADGVRRSMATSYAQEHLSEVPLVALKRVGRVVGAYLPGHTVVSWSTWSSVPEAVVWAWILGGYLLAPFALAGAIMLRRHKRPIVPLVVPILTIVLTVAGTIGEIRYRAAAEISLVVLASVALAALSESLRKRSQSPSAAESSTIPNLGMDASNPR